MATSALLPEGLRDTEKSTRRKYIGFHPGTDIRRGDLLRGKTSGTEFLVVDVDAMIVHGKVFSVKAYYAVQDTIKREPTNSINIGQMVNSAVQQGSPGSAQSLYVTISEEKKADLSQIIQELLTVLDQLDLSDDDKNEVQAEARNGPGPAEEGQSETLDHFWLCPGNQGHAGEIRFPSNKHGGGRTAQGAAGQIFFLARRLIRRRADDIPCRRTPA